MNIKRFFIGALCLLFVITACTNQRSKGYNPPEPKSTDLPSDITKVDSANKSGFKLTIMSQKPSDEFPLSATQALESKMLSISSKNGIVGYGGNPAFVFAALLTPISKDVTSTPPIKYTIKYTLNMYVANIVTGDVYGTYSTDIMGVGKSFELAAVNAMSSIKDNSQIQNMLISSEEKIISWFSHNSKSFIALVNDYIERNEYGKAYVLLTSVPEQATECFTYAQKNKTLVYKKFKYQQCAENYAKMIDVIARTGKEYNPEVGAYLQMMPSDTPEYKRALEVYENYIASIAKSSEEKAEREFFLEKERLVAQKLELEARYKESEAMQAQQAAEASVQGNSIISQIANQAVQLGVSEIIGFIL